jgi:hypothetical protein
MWQHTANKDQDQEQWQQQTTTTTMATMKTRMKTRTRTRTRRTPAKNDREHPWHGKDDEDKKSGMTRKSWQQQ